MIDNINIDIPQIKPLDRNVLDCDLLYQDITELDEIYFEDFIRHESCSRCGHDHRFKSRYKGVKTSIDHTSELISLIFKEDLSKGE
jgi:hypothetical protein